MAEQNRQTSRDLRGGTEGGEAARLIDPETRSEGTRGHTAPSGGTHVGAPASAVPRTGLADRSLEGTGQLAGGKSARQVMGYLGGITFPAKKDALIHAARRNGAPEDVFGAMEQLSQTEYASEEELLRDYPRLEEAHPVHQ